ncbi:MAG: FAD-binding protein, partial [Saprospiraceae bacterium]|nr:FAD-binding protein [Saprospiraceae bacterium]
MAGLLAARVLSDHFAEVVVIEKDAVPDQPLSRKGQPQTRHLHGLLAKGLDILESLFPGLTEELIRHGAIYDDMGSAIRWHQFGGYRKQFTSHLMGVVQSRPLLECLVRQRVVALPNVSLRDQCAATGLQLTNGRVTGLALIRNGEQAITQSTDLVVDCSGRGSRASSWLAELGFPIPTKSEVTVNLGYATRTYRWQPDHLSGARVCMSLPSPPEVKRSGFLLPVEGNRWMLTLAGWHRDYPPADEAGFNAFAGSLPLPDIYRIIEAAQPLSNIITHRFKSSRRFHFEKLSSFPHGFIVLGDAVASFNPVYAQGMTAAAMQAEALGACLRVGLGGRALFKQYFRRVSRIIDIPWQLATGEDFRFKQTVGPKPPGTDLL